MIWLAAVAVGLALLLYLRLPVDLVPDTFGPIGLLDDAVALLVGVWWLRRRLTRARAAQPETRAAAEDSTAKAAWDPYAVLAVARDASPEEITRAYREQMKRYHPDRVANLGEELRQLAHLKALDIQRAYAEIGRG